MPKAARYRRLYLEGGGRGGGQKWNDAIIMVLHKKKDREEFDKYKGIPLVT